MKRLPMTVFLAMLALSPALMAGDVIYKCKSATGAITFSAKPCVSAQEVKKIESRETVISREPVLPGSIPGRKGMVSPEPAPDDRPKHTPKPLVREGCRAELFNLKRDLDTRFIATEAAIKQEQAALAQNTRDLSDAQSSKVGAQWSANLTEQRQGIESRLANAQAALSALYVEEKSKYTEIAKRCKAP